MKTSTIAKVLTVVLALTAAATGYNFNRAADQEKYRQHLLDNQKAIAVLKWQTARALSGHHATTAEEQKNEERACVAELLKLRAQIDEQVKLGEYEKLMASATTIRDHLPDSNVAGDALCKFAADLFVTASDWSEGTPSIVSRKGPTVARFKAQAEDLITLLK